MNRIDLFLICILTSFCLNAFAASPFHPYEEVRFKAGEGRLSVLEGDVSAIESNVQEFSKVFEITFPATSSRTSTGYVIPANAVITDAGAILETSTTSETALTVDCVTGSATAPINAQNLSAKVIGATITGYTDGTSTKWIPVHVSTPCDLAITTPNDTDATAQLSMFVRYFIRN